MTPIIYLEWQSNNDCCMLFVDGRQRKLSAFTQSYWITKTSAYLEEYDGKEKHSGVLLVPRYLQVEKDETRDLRVERREYGTVCPGRHPAIWPQKPLPQQRGWPGVPNSTITQMTRRAFLRR